MCSDTNECSTKYMQGRLFSVESAIKAPAASTAKVYSMMASRTSGYAALVMSHQGT